MKYYVGADGKREFLRHCHGLPIIVDVLRASSTIVCALWTGAERIIPVVDAKEALRLGKQIDAALVGERGGVKIEGFDYNNSPAEILNADLKDKTVVITTSNGTKIMAEGGVIASTLNAGAVAGLVDKKDHAYLLASPPEKSAEDLYASRLIELMIEKLGQGTAMDETVQFARTCDECVSLLEGIRHSFAGEKVAMLGYQKDVEMVCTEINKFPVVPIYKDGSIKLR